MQPHCNSNPPKHPKSLGKTSNLHSLLSQSHQSLMLSRSLLPCGRRGNPYVHIPNNSKIKIKAEVVLQGIDGKRGRDFHEGEEVGKKCAASMSSTTGTAAYPCSTEPKRLVKSATTTLVRQEEKGCFQDLEIL